MSGRARCSCQSCTIRSYMGPAVVITIGVILLLNEVGGGALYWGNTWPVLLIVIGLMHLGSAMASREGHLTAQPVASAPPPPPTPPASPAQTPHSAPGQ